MPRLSRRALFWLLPLALLAALGWKLLAGQPSGAGSRPARVLSAGEVQTACLDTLSRHLGTAASRMSGGAPGWDGHRWAWRAVARVDGGPLAFGCTVTPDGRAVVRVLN